jgi:hypothetical protein
VVDLGNAKCNALDLLADQMVANLVTTCKGAASSVFGMSKTAKVMGKFSFFKMTGASAAWSRGHGAGGHREPSGCEIPIGSPVGVAVDCGRLADGELIPNVFGEQPGHNP